MSGVQRITSALMSTVPAIIKYVSVIPACTPIILDAKCVSVKCFILSLTKCVSVIPSCTTLYYSVKCISLKCITTVDSRYLDIAYLE